MDRTNQEGNQLSFGNGKTNVSPYYGIKENGPYGLSPFSKTHFFLIFHKDDLQAAHNVKGYLQNGLEFFKGLQKFAKVYFHTEPGFSIQFTDRENPLPEIETTLSNRTFNADLKYFAIYITPISRDNRPKKMELQGKAFSNSLTNISVAILAKLKGIP